MPLYEEKPLSPKSQRSAVWAEQELLNFGLLIDSPSATDYLEVEETMTQSGTGSGRGPVKELQQTLIFNAHIDERTQVISAVVISTDWDVLMDVYQEQGSLMYLPEATNQMMYNHSQHHRNSLWDAYAARRVTAHREMMQDQVVADVAKQRTTRQPEKAAATDNVEVLDLAQTSVDDAQGFTCCWIFYIPHSQKYHAGYRYPVYTDVGVSVSLLPGWTVINRIKKLGQLPRAPDRGDSKDTVTSLFSSDDETEGECILCPVIQ